METRFGIGDTVEAISTNVRMKVESIDGGDGSVTCSWKRGRVTHRKRFQVCELAPATVSAFPNPEREGSGLSAARGGPRRSSSPARGSPSH